VTDSVCSAVNICLWQHLPGQVSLTFDSWTSQNGDPFLSVTGHYITSLPGRPEEWELRTDQLAFTAVEGNHSGANMANIILRVIDRYDLRNKVSPFGERVRHVTLINDHCYVGWMVDL
jgi:hypothetical protein